MKAKKKQTNRRRAQTHSPASVHTSAPFVEHLYELRKRLYYIAISLAVWSAAAYGVQQQIVAILLKPSNGQRFIYTSVGGGIDFLFRICIYTALIMSLPVIIYNVMRFVEPVITKSSRRFIVWASITSGLLALAGMAFGYVFGLPSALHFLSHQFTTVQIRPLVTIQAYLGFVTVYMLGAALLFQLPLILLLINRIKPLNPKRLFKYERWVILVAFVLSCLMNPTPNIFSQLLIAGPFIIMYQVGIVLIVLVNRNRRAAQELHQRDVDAQASRQARTPSLQLLQEPDVPSTPISATPMLATAVSPVMAAEVTAPRPSLQRKVTLSEVQRPVRPRPPVTRVQMLTPMAAPHRQTFHDIKVSKPRPKIQSIDNFRLPSI